MKELVTCTQMKNLDEYTIEKMGIPSCVLMERAALCTVEEMKKRMKAGKETEKILVVCGSGNNGGDGIAIARLLHLDGWKVCLFLLGKEEKMTPETALQLKIARNYQVPEKNNLDLCEYTTIVDAIFGVGLKRPVEGRYAQIIRELNAAAAFKVAVDIPSGINGDTGFEMGTAFRADLTVTFAFRKRGLCFYPGRMYGGEITVADIGIYTKGDSDSSMHHLEKSDLSLLPDMLPYGNKGTFGKVLFVSGSPGMCGAAFLAASAAFKCGAGMVKIQTVEENRIPLQTLLPEAMLTCTFTEEENQKNLDWCDVLVIGPGLGLTGTSRERAQWFLSHGAQKGIPIILDADGLNLLSVHPDWQKYLGSNTIVTPHIGEMSRLCGKSIGEIQNSLVETALDYSQSTGCVCVLKDACTTIASPEGKTFLNLSGNAGMATAGSGDVLSGVLAGIQCMYHFAKHTENEGMKAALGVYIHGLAGDLAAQTLGRRGMTARDIIRFLPEILKK